MPRTSSNSSRERNVLSGLSIQNEESGNTILHTASLGSLRSFKATLANRSNGFKTLSARSWTSLLSIKNKKGNTVAHILTKKERVGREL